MSKARNASPQTGSQTTPPPASSPSSGNQPAATKSLRIGFVSAFPPGRNSLNEFGFHMVSKLADKSVVAEVLLYADDTDAGRPQVIDGVTPVVCWKFKVHRRSYFISDGL